MYKNLLIFSRKYSTQIKVRYFSDTHIELINPNNINKYLEQIPSGNNEICVLAGDIGNPFESNYDKFMYYMNKHFERTFVIAGNHEYYNNNQTIQQTDNYMIKLFKQYKNIKLLNNEYELYRNYCFIGTTLWTKINLNDSNNLNSINQIPNFSYKEYNELNKKCINFLEETLKKNNNCIITTHHVPSNRFVDPKYNTSTLKLRHQWFYNDLDKLIDRYTSKINCWIYGHTHMPMRKEENGLYFLCNPIGYPYQKINVNFNEKIILKIK
jgi:predicted phosphodiesterase